MSSPSYRNNISKLLLGRLFDQQWVLPRPVSFIERIFLLTLERIIVRPDFRGIDIDRPIFIISLPRSGSSMLQDLLCAHSDISYISNIMNIYSPYYCGVNYIKKILDLDVEGERFLRDSVMVNGGTPSDPVSVWNRWYGIDQESLDFVDLSIFDMTESQIELIKTEIKKIIWCFRSRGGARFLSKNPGLMPYMSVTSEIFPDARFIYLVRDPRQNANSMRKLYRLCEEQRTRLPWNEPELIPFPRLPGLKEAINRFGADSVEATGHIWNSAAKFMHAWESRENVFTVRYEDILSDPKGVVGSIMNFCGMDFVGAENPEFQSRMQRIGKTHHKNPDYGQFESIEAICGEEMKRLGYR